MLGGRGGVGHRRLVRDQPGERGGNPDIDHEHGRGVLPSQRIDGGATLDEVGHHLGGHLLRPRRDTLRMDAVVGGEHRDGSRFRDRRRTGAGDPGQPDRDLFQHAERTTRLGQPVLPVAGGGQRGRIGGVNRADGSG
jgi:hypothetical protein